MKTNVSVLSGQDQARYRAPLSLALYVMKNLLPIFVLMLCSACSKNETYEHVLEIDKNTGSFSFSQAVKGNWNQVCFFGPYSSNATAKSILGFEWDLEKYSRIYNNDGITLAVFIKDTDVVTYKEISRYADFSKFSGQCFPKAKTKFNVAPGNVIHTQ